MVSIQFLFFEKVFAREKNGFLLDLKATFAPKTEINIA